MDDEEKPMDNLGYMNGWTETPEIVKQCEIEKHQREWKRIGRCLERCTCHECGYTFKVDSSD